MNLSRDVVAKVAKLARIRLTADEEEALAVEIGNVLSYVEQLQELNVDGVEPLAHCLPLQNAFRCDEQRPSLAPDDALGNAPKRAGDFFSVPAILD
jgi:aspartyl-tRNA(Asn)/glutamyl-tRNA(Gln) amidotransferase subunit C